MGSKGTLVVVVLKARNLKDNHTFYRQDPYALIRLSGTGKSTTADVRGGQHPVWDEEFHFPVYEDRIMKISCFSKEKKVDELLGEAEIDITRTLETGEFDEWVSLESNGQKRGEIYLECTFYSAAPPLARRPSKLTPWERLSRPPATPPKDPQSLPSSQGNSPRHTPNPRTSPHVAQKQQQSNTYLTVQGQSGNDAPLPSTSQASPPRVPSILRPSNPKSSPIPLRPDTYSAAGSTMPEPASLEASRHTRTQQKQQDTPLPNPFDSRHETNSANDRLRSKPPPIPSRPDPNSAQEKAYRRISQEQADAEFARQLAESEGFDLERLKAEESDAELARRLAAEDSIPGGWNG